MRTRLDAARVLLRIAFRNLLASRAKTAIMGGIIGLGSLLVVFGTAVVDSLDAGMARSRSAHCAARSARSAGGMSTSARAWPSSSRRIAIIRRTCALRAW